MKYIHNTNTCICKHQYIYWILYWSYYNKQTFYITLTYSIWNKFSWQCTKQPNSHVWNMTDRIKRLTLLTEMCFSCFPLWTCGCSISTHSRFLRLSPDRSEILRLVFPAGEAESDHCEKQVSMWIIDWRPRTFLITYIWIKQTCYTISFIWIGTTEVPWTWTWLFVNYLSILLTCIACCVFHIGHKRW